MAVELSPSQREAYERLLEALRVGNVFLFWAGTGMGKTTVLQAVHRRQGGIFLNMGHFMEAMRTRRPLALEETFEELVMAGLQAHDCVIVDDLHLLTEVVAGNCMLYPRRGLLDAPLTTLATYAMETGKQLIFGSQD